MAGPGGIATCGQRASREGRQVGQGSEDPAGEDDADKGGWREMEDLRSENAYLKDELDELRAEMEELRDGWLEEDVQQVQELRRELDRANKNSRILQYRLKKAERRGLRAGGSNGTDGELLRSIEQDLKVSRDVSVRLHGELRVVEDRRARLEAENDTLREQLLELDVGRQALQQELEKNRENSLRRRGRELTKADKKLPVQEDNADLRCQLQFSKEEAMLMRKKTAKVGKERDRLEHELQKYHAFYGELDSGGVFGEAGGPPSSREAELRLRLKLVEEEATSLGRKIVELEVENRGIKAELEDARAQYESVAGMGHATEGTGAGTGITMSVGSELEAQSELRRQLQFVEEEAEMLRRTVAELEDKNRQLAVDSSKGNTCASGEAVQSAASFGLQEELKAARLQINELSGKVLKLQYEKRPAAGSPSSSSDTTNAVETSMCSEPALVDASSAVVIITDDEARPPHRKREGPIGGESDATIENEGHGNGSGNLDGSNIPEALALLLANQRRRDDARLTRARREARRLEAMAGQLSNEASENLIGTEGDAIGTLVSGLKELRHDLRVFIEDLGEDGDGDGVCANDSNDIGTALVGQNVRTNGINSRSVNSEKSEQSLERLSDCERPGKGLQYSPATFGGLVACGGPGAGLIALASWLRGLLRQRRQDMGKLTTTGAEGQQTDEGEGDVSEEVTLSASIDDSGFHSITDTRRQDSVLELQLLISQLYSELGAAERRLMTERVERERERERERVSWDAELTQQSSFSSQAGCDSDEDTAVPQTYGLRRARSVSSMSEFEQMMDSSPFLPDRPGLVTQPSNTSSAWSARSPSPSPPLSPDDLRFVHEFAAARSPQKTAAFCRGHPEGQSSLGKEKGGGSVWASSFTGQSADGIKERNDARHIVASVTMTQPSNKNILSWGPTTHGPPAPALHLCNLSDDMKRAAGAYQRLHNAGTQTAARTTTVASQTESSRFGQAFSPRGSYLLLPPRSGVSTPTGSSPSRASTGLTRGRLSSPRLGRRSGRGAGATTPTTLGGSAWARSTTTRDSPIPRSLRDDGPTSVFAIVMESARVLPLGVDPGHLEHTSSPTLNHDTMCGGSFPISPGSVDGATPEASPGRSDCCCVGKPDTSTEESGATTQADDLLPANEASSTLSSAPPSLLTTA
uniref:microtubule cross-linking factor 2-like isoform X2 n=1 Tax=Myxine glutinosa TaxID=7769 RepID=UPI00358EAA22